MITRGCVLRLGISQLMAWGVTHYAIGVFGESMTAELGWGRAAIYAGFSVALVVMGLASPLVGRCVDRWGGGPVMGAGALCAALGLAGIAVAQAMPLYYAAWACLGLAMRAMLYDAAFAALTRLGGATARGPMAQITLLGGLASTCFWPLGHALAGALGWRGALLAYAGLALAIAPLNLSLPRGRAADDRSGQPRDGSSGACPTAPAITPGPRRDALLAAALYALLFALTTGISTGMAAHVIAILQGLGLPASLSVSLALLFGVGQFLARLSVVAGRGRLHPATLNLIAGLALPLAFALPLVLATSPALPPIAGPVPDCDAGPSAAAVATAAAFVLCYGVGNGILSITRGSLPLIFFDVATYGTVVGRLLAPSFLVSAVSPLVFAAVMDRFGAPGTLRLALAIALAVCAASLGLKILAARRAGRRPAEA
ncbi:MAG: MFS transporter [Desulfovibrionaceae bacterium]|jgi:MFS family permease|nr:MFS transporter [Desulfovibrionaceae bacterium]